MKPQRNTNKWILLFIGLALLLLSGQAVQAALTAVGPTDPGNGFPLWYQDSNALTLELCLPNTAELAAGACLLLPADIPNPTAPILFPTNFPEEAFWFAAGAIIPLGTGSADLVLGLEGAFATGPVIPGEQVSFGRVRIRVDAPSAGLYTITHPYGIHTFNVTAPGIRAINFTSDIGIGAPGDFTGALGSAIGPFLRASAAPGGAPLDFFSSPTLNPTKKYLVDPALPSTKVTGGPFGNEFRVQGPGGLDISTTDFTLNGRLFNGDVPTPLAVTRATYGRSNATPSVGHVDVFANSAPTAAVTVTGVGVPTWPLTGDGTGRFFAHIPISNATTLPATLTITADNTVANPNNPPTSIAVNLVDQVIITQADYSAFTGNLTVTAASSDLLAPAPNLTLVGFTPGALTSGVPADFLTPAPPAVINVSSSKGGSDSKKIVIGPALPAALPPVARNDSALATAGAAKIIPVLANDLALVGALDPVSVTVTAQPANGTAVDNADGTITYTSLPGFNGDVIFTYTVADNQPLTSNTATVRVTVTGLPVAVNDAAATLQNVAVVIPVLANDTATVPNFLDPSTVTIVTPPTSGAVSVSLATGNITFTPAVAFTGVVTFTYTVQDNLGQVTLPATVTVTVNPLNPAPMAVDDNGTVAQGASVIIPVLANDTGTINFASLTVASPPAHGTVSVNVLNGTIAYTHTNLAFTGTDTFTYTVRNTLGVISNVATVTVTIITNAEVITTDRAEYNLRLRQWTVAGRTTAPSPPANTMTIRTGATPGAGTVIGTATVGVDGKWSFNRANSPVAFDAAVNVVSSYGKSATAAVRQR
ncbi:MAG: tandem-95 repeat protein [Deltaproteobacteria bacterium]|nr:tandem-95 repeat protein [Deltaproteobacteria bacterium]